MKLQTNQNTIQRSSDFQSTNYKIEATAKAFSILSDGLYSNKIKAVIRELSTNAYDAHVSAGCPDSPFRVQLPTKLEPVFVVRDFGTGLSYDDCFNLYTTYFGSNKTDSNDAVGCLGLGSKSPFAYTDSFMVESFFNGTRYVFNSYMNETGSPEFALLHEEPTDEPNGMQISMNVESNDIWEFESEAKSIFQHFVVRPEINAELEYKPEEVKIGGDNWSVLKRRSGNHVIMGQISYPIDDTQFQSEETDDIWRALRTLGNLRLCMNIGDIDITPSRESISYTGRTKHNITRTINRIIESIGEKAKEDILACTNLWSARWRAMEIFDTVGRIGNLADDVLFEIEFNGQKVFEDGSEFINLKTDNDERLMIVRYTKSKWRETCSREDVNHIRAGKGHVFYQDKKSGSVARIRHLLREENEGIVYLIPNGKLEQVAKCLGCEPEYITNVTTLPAPPKQVSKTTSSSSYVAGLDGLYKSKGEGYNDWYEGTFNVGVKEEDAYYIIQTRGDMEIKGYNVGTRYIKSALNVLDSLGVDTSHLSEKLFYVTPSKAKTMKLEERDNWQDGLEYIQNQIKRQLVIMTNDLTLLHNSSTGKWSIGNEHTGRVATLQELHPLLSSRGDFYEFSKLFHPDYSVDQDLLTRLKETAQRLKVWTDFADNLEENSSESLDTDELYDSIVEKYPMLQFATGWMSDEQLQVIASYIDSMEV